MTCQSAEWEWLQDYEHALWAQLDNEQRRYEMDASKYAEVDSQFLKKEDIGHHRPKVQIDRVEEHRFDDGKESLAVFFVGKQKGVSLNKTNTRALIDAFGKETSDWIGQQIELWVDWSVEYQGHKGGIRTTPFRTTEVGDEPNF